jgi:hypothetical protein
MFSVIVPRISELAEAVAESIVKAPVLGEALRKFVVVESVVARNSSAPEVAAFELVTTALTVSESVAALKTDEAAIETVAVSDVVIAEAVTEGVSVTETGAACEGATESTPRPKAATATSATRLNVVFVDICFLSIVDLRNFRRSAWASNALS